MSKYLLITGASSGVGRELAVELSEEHALIIAGRSLDRLEETKMMCSKKNDILIWNYDLKDVDNIENDIETFIKTNLLEIDAFIHCAGVMKMYPCRVLTSDVFEEVYRVNVFAPALITKVLTKKKINDKNLKSVVFISSNISNRGAKSFSVYGSSKAALDGLMRSLAIELAPSVRVNSVLPGAMKTKMTEEMFEDEELKTHFENTYPLGIGTPSDIYPMVEFLISDDARWITGQQMVVDGGRTIDLTE